MTEKDSLQHKSSADEAPRRVIYDAEGRRWTVYESRITYDRRESRTLVFDSLDIMRRVRHFPDDWVEWSDKALLELSNTV